jgi:hypothetical protein
MREDEAVESFASMFQAGFAAEPERIEKRLRSEKRSTQTPKQRKRGAVRTTKITFRCSPEFHALAKALGQHTGLSVADLAEEAFDLLAKAKKFTGGE